MAVVYEVLESGVLVLEGACLALLAGLVLVHGVSGRLAWRETVGPVALLWLMLVGPISLQVETVGAAGDGLLGLDARTTGAVLLVGGAVGTWAVALAARAEDRGPRAGWGRSLLGAVAFVLVSWVVSLPLLHDSTVPARYEDLWERPEHIGLWHFVLGMGTLPLVAAVLEEWFFRGALLGVLTRWTRSRRGQALAVALTSAVWALEHLNNVVEWPAKLTQVFVMGLMLGALRLRLGLRAAVLGHLLFNGSALVFYGLTEGLG